VAIVDFIANISFANKFKFSYVLSGLQIDFEIPLKGSKELFFFDLYSKQAVEELGHLFHCIHAFVAG
jgi:hypothetical protein